MSGDVYKRQVIFPAGTAKLRQCYALTTAGIPDCPGALHLITEQDGQPVPQFGIVGGRIDRDPHLTEEGRVEDSLMGLAVCRNKTGTVDGLSLIHISCRRR